MKVDILGDWLIVVFVLLIVVACALASNKLDSK